MIPALLLMVTAATMELPEVSDRAPVRFDHFPTTVHAFVWRNWQLVPTKRMADVIDATDEDVLRMGRAMGLDEPPTITDVMRKRSYITVIRRNWHLLPYEQLTGLLGMTESELAFTLREDDFLYIKLGRMKPKCAPLRYEEPTPEVMEREREIKETIEAAFPNGATAMEEPLFQFVDDLSKPLENAPEPHESRFSPRYCSSYFALFGDPLIEEDIDPFPKGYIQRLVASGVDSVWMHAVMYQLAPYPWDEALSADYEKRLERLRELTDRLDEHGIGLFLYMNEPRAMPLPFFKGREHLKGVVEGDHAAMCTSVPEVRDYLADSIATVSEAAPKLRGFFTITASENLTNCWSHHRGDGCPRCSKREPADVIAEVNATVWEGIQRAGNGAELICWDWGWRDEWAVNAINQLPQDVALQSVSEWSIPIERGGVKNTVGEYSISTIGPGPRATKHWAAARERGLKTVAKIQAGNTWEIAAVPYIPALANVAQHGANLREAKIDGIMLGWSLGGYPSPNLEVIAEMAAPSDGDPVTTHEAMMRVARARYGDEHAAAVARAWERCSEAFSEFPYDGSVVYRAPLQVGPANPLWSEATAYSSTMIGFPYDDLKGWRGPYPAEVFIEQFETMADGFDAALLELRASLGDDVPWALQGELNVMETVAIHYRSTAQQSRFVEARRALAEGANVADELEELVRSERELAVRLHEIQTRDSRIGYEASNHYFYVPSDLAEKVINCEYLLTNWIAQLKNTN